METHLTNKTGWSLLDQYEGDVIVCEIHKDASEVCKVLARNLSTKTKCPVIMC